MAALQTKAKRAWRDLLAQPEDSGTDLNLILRLYLKKADAPDLADRCGSIRSLFDLSGISTVAEVARMAPLQSRPVRPGRWLAPLRRNRQRPRAAGASSSALTLAALTDFGVNSGKTNG
jgi:hypothetical protein